MDILDHSIERIGRFHRMTTKRRKFSGWKMNFSLRSITSMQAFFLCKTRKLSSWFSKTQIPKILENSVFSRKLSSKIQKVTKNHSKKGNVYRNLCSKPSNFQKTQFQKRKNSVFQKFKKHKWRKTCTKKSPV